MDLYGNAISSIESGGRYDILGPVTRSGDRAYGKYQVMGANIGPWTAEILGRAMTPQEFLADAQAQDAVFNARFGQYARKYGPEGAARAWFAGEGGMNDPGRKDILGTSVADYAAKFNRALGGPFAVPTTPAAPAAQPATISEAVTSFAPNFESSLTFPPAEGPSRGAAAPEEPLDFGALFQPRTYSHLRASRRG